MTEPRLVRPAMEHLAEYCAALGKGWSPNNLRPEVAQEQLDTIARDAEGFLASLEDPEARGGPVLLPDGSTVPRLPSLRRWIWKDGFAGSIGLRWQPGTADLPLTCSGHLGYAVVPWRRREGLASFALRAILPRARAVGLPYVDLTVEPENAASVGVIRKCGGVLVTHRDKHPSVGTGTEALYRIQLETTQ